MEYRISIIAGRGASRFRRWLREHDGVVAVDSLPRQDAKRASASDKGLDSDYVVFVRPCPKDVTPLNVIAVGGDVTPNTRSKQVLAAFHAAI